MVSILTAAEERWLRGRTAFGPRIEFRRRGKAGRQAPGSILQLGEKNDKVCRT
jgi:hypothetical protein